MRNRYIFSFFTSLPDMDLVGERILISQWRAAWSKAGLTPIVLNEFWARKHPAFAEFDAAVSQLPSVNPKGYDLACYHRWLAVQVAAQEYRNVNDHIVLMDYDVWGYPDIPDVRRLGLHDLISHRLVHMHGEMYDLHDKRAPMFSLHGNCPALVIGTPDQFAQVCHWFATIHPPEGTEHTSDQYLFEQFIEKNPGKVKTSMDVVLFSEPGWETASAVHFANAVMPNHLPKWKHIPTLR